MERIILYFLFWDILGTEPTLINLFFKGLERTSQWIHAVMERCSVFHRDHVSVKATSLIYLFRAAVPSLDQHIFAFASAALSACSKHPSLSYDHASIMSRDPNPVEHTSFPWQGGGRGGSTRGRGLNIPQHGLISPSFRE